MTELDFLKFVRAIDHFCGWSDVIRLDDVLAIAREIHGLSMSEEELHRQINASNDFELAELFINSSGSKALFVWDKRRQNRKVDTDSKQDSLRKTDVENSVPVLPAPEMQVPGKQTI